MLISWIGAQLKWLHGELKKLSEDCPYSTGASVVCVLSNVASLEQLFIAELLSTMLAPVLLRDAEWGSHLRAAKVLLGALVPLGSKAFSDSYMMGLAGLFLGEKVCARYGMFWLDPPAPAPMDPPARGPQP